MVEVYNEFSLQHELGIHLRGHPNFSNQKVQFERNVGLFNAHKSLNWTKKEIDISIFTNTTSPKLAIELKYPRSGQHPESMFSFCKDIRFLEELKAQANFKTAILIVLADDPLFYSGNGTKGIYRYFRGTAPLQGNIQKPTGKKNSSVSLAGSYQVQWQTIVGNLKYFTLTV